jgi:hypothetical protein
MQTHQLGLIVARARDGLTQAGDARPHKSSGFFPQWLALAACVGALVAPLPASAAPPAQGRVMWLDATALQLADGARVDQWPDLSGVGNHAVQADPDRRPLYVASGTPFGEPVVRFSGAAPFEHLVVQQMGPYPVPYTIFLVWKINQNTGGDQQALDGSDEGQRVRIGYQANPSRIFAWSGGGFPNLEKSMAVPFDNLILTSAVYDPSGGLFRVNGELEQENPTGDISLSGFTLGRRVTDAQQLAGDIAELLVYDRRLESCHHPGG